VTRRMFECMLRLLPHVVLRRLISLGLWNRLLGPGSRIAALMVGTRRFGALLHSEPYIRILLHLTTRMRETATDRMSTRYM
jgi:hypothetical protein